VKPGEFSGLRCPQCGSALLVQDEAVWCSFVDGREIKGCDWGIKERKTLAGLVIPLREALEFYAYPGSNMHAYGHTARKALQGQGRGVDVLDDVLDDVEVK